MNTLKSKDGTKIAFDEQGDGPQLAKLLAQHFTVYSYDRRGRGASGDTKPYAVEREIEDIDALIDEAGGSAFVYGHSVGGARAAGAPRAVRPQREGVIVSLVFVYFVVNQCGLSRIRRMEPSVAPGYRATCSGR